MEKEYLTIEERARRANLYKKYPSEVTEFPKLSEIFNDIYNYESPKFWEKWFKTANIEDIKLACKGIFLQEVPEEIKETFPIEGEDEFLVHKLKPNEFVDFAFELFQEGYDYVFQEWFGRWMVYRLTPCKEHIEMAIQIVNGLDYSDLRSEFYKRGCELAEELAENSLNNVLAVIDINASGGGFQDL